MLQRKGISPSTVRADIRKFIELSRQQSITEPFVGIMLRNQHDCDDRSSLDSSLEAIESRIRPRSDDGDRSSIETFLWGSASQIRSIEDDIASLESENTLALRNSQFHNTRQPTTDEHFTRI